MGDICVVTGMIIKSVPVMDYDRHVCILTRERGKITAYVKGARRQNSKLLAATNPFCFGQFKLFPGRENYSLVDAEISEYFEPLRDDFEAAYYGMYFMELADYYARENSDELEPLKLLYQTLRALCSHRFPNPLIRAVYEIKTYVVNGEFPGIPQGLALSESAAYAVDYIVNSTVEKLYTFTLTDAVLAEVSQVAKHASNLLVDRRLKSLEILESITLA